MSFESNFSDDEILKVLFSLKDYKAPIPDGFNVGFFTKARSIVVSDTINVIRSFFI